MTTYLPSGDLKTLQREMGHGQVQPRKVSVLRSVALTSQHQVFRNAKTARGREFVLREDAVANEDGVCEVIALAQATNTVP